jgi:hypothetical protein
MSFEGGGAGWGASGPRAAPESTDSGAPHSRIRRLGTSAIATTPIQTNQRRLAKPKKTVLAFCEAEEASTRDDRVSPRAIPRKPRSPKYSPSGSPTITGRGRRLRVAAAVSLQPSPISQGQNIHVTPVQSGGGRRVQLSSVRSAQTGATGSASNAITQFKPATRRLGSSLRDSNGYSPAVSFPQAHPRSRRITSSSRTTQALNSLMAKANDQSPSVSANVGNVPAVEEKKMTRPIGDNSWS